MAVGFRRVGVVMGEHLSAAEVECLEAKVRAAIEDELQGRLFSFDRNGGFFLVRVHDISVESMTVQFEDAS